MIVGGCQKIEGPDLIDNIHHTRSIPTIPASPDQSALCDTGDTPPVGGFWRNTESGKPAGNKSYFQFSTSCTSSEPCHLDVPGGGLGDDGSEGGLGVQPRPRVDVDVRASVDAADLRGEVAGGALGGAWTGTS